MQTALENPSEFISREEEHQRLLEVLETAGEGRNSLDQGSNKGSTEDLNKEPTSHKNSLIETQISVEKSVHHQVSFDKVSHKLDSILIFYKFREVCVELNLHVKRLTVKHHQFLIYVEEWSENIQFYLNLVI